MKYKITALVASVILILDQLTKWVIIQQVPLGHRIPVLENFFDIVHVRNRGAAFGILSQWDSAYRDIFFYVLSVVAVLFLLSFVKQSSEEDKITPVSIGLILGGALGNVMDRAIRGSVVDFLSFHWYNRAVDWEVFGYSLQFDLIWPSFNVADSAITIGILTLLIVIPALQKREVSRQVPERVS